MYKSVRLIAGGALVGSVLTATGFILTQEQARLNKEASTDNHRLFKYGIPESSITVHAYKGHWLAYDNAKRIPVWVAELLTNDTLHQHKTADRQQSNFKVDPNVPVEYRASNIDYLGSGWSRGHMAAAANHAHDQQEMNETFYLSNVVPQVLNNNIGFWSRLEMFCRELAAHYHEVRVLTGPLFLPQTANTNGQENDKSFVHYEVIGRNRVAVPTHLYKVIMLDDNTSKEPCLGAFIIPNKSIKGEVSLVKYQASLKTLENHLGTKMLPQLDPGKAGWNTTVCRDLCHVTGCKLMPLEKFELVRYSQRLRNAPDLNSLEEIWREMKETGKQPDSNCTKQYSQRKDDFLNRNL